MKNNLLAVSGIGAILLFNANLLRAQDSTRNLSLKEAIDLSVKNSKQLKISQAKIEEATAALKVAVQGRLPDAGFGGAYYYVTQPDISVKLKSNNSGGSGSSGGLNLSEIKVSQAMYGSLNVSLPIYTGLKIKSGIESAKFLELATRLDADHDQEEIIQNSINLFVNLYKAKAGVDLVRESLAESRQRVSDFSNLEKNGLLARNDLLKA